MITFLVLAVIAVLGYFGIEINGLVKDSKKLKTKEAEGEAKKIVDSKSNDELADDINKRYRGSERGDS